ncbi:MAG: HU family DNA-binding protein [Albidovulum sp.]|uniref:HU family DNA-binding protein n=1 Tax=Albidovulum sp. TaxID=1872424 RepID=UPI003C8E95C0
MTARKTTKTPAKATRAPASAKPAALAGATVPSKTAAPVKKQAPATTSAEVPRLPTADIQTGDIDKTVLRKKELFERVVDATGAKKKDVKPIVEATLKALGDALSAGEDLVLPPLGKAKVNRQKDLGSAEMLVIRLRRQDEKPAEAATDGGADAD